MSVLLKHSTGTVNLQEVKDIGFEDSKPYIADYRRIRCYATGANKEYYFGSLYVSPAADGVILPYETVEDRLQTVKESLLASRWIEDPNVNVRVYHTLFDITSAARKILPVPDEKITRLIRSN